MEIVDMNKINNHIMKDLFKKGMKRPCVIVPFFGSLLVSGCAIYNGNILLALLSLSSTQIVSVIMKDFARDNADNYYEQVYGQIRETKEYSKALCLYKEYLKNISSFLKKMELDNSIDYSIYTEKMLKSGYLSNNKEFKYYDYLFDETCTPELVGSRITTGTGVCRHIAIFSSDVLNELGIESTPISVRFYNKELEKVSIKKIRNIKSDHLVVGIIDSSGKYIFDPTMGYYGSFCQNEKYKEFVSQVVNVDCPKYYFLDNKDSNIYTSGSSTLSVFNNGQYKDDLLSKLIESREKVSSIFEKSTLENNGFYEKNKTLIKELANINKVICPYSDERKQKWILHK